MLCDSEKMGSSTQWTQRMMMIPPTNSNSQSNTTAAKRSSSSMTQPPPQQQQQQQQQQQPQPQQLKCPRCNSSNTKFCYYNNYSLSQPRHFCKACKRYWTRGGTLRNVPVGGGCRKNKRIKKHQQTPQPSSAAATATVSAATGTVAIPAPRSSSSIVNNLATTVDLSSFLYGDVNLGGGYEALGLAGLIPHSDQLSTGFVNNNSSNLHSCFLNNEYPASFGSQAASLLVSSMKQPSKVEDQYAQPSLPYEGLQQGYESLNLGFVKDVKVEDSNNLNNIGNNSASDQWQANYPFEVLNGASDSSYMYWSSAMGGSVWPDPSSSSVAPLI